MYWRAETPESGQRRNALYIQRAAGIKHAPAAAINVNEAVSGERQSALDRGQLETVEMMDI